MFKTHACITIHCEVCGEAPDYDGGTLHFATEKEAVQDARDLHEWTITRSGKVFCDGHCDLSKPDCVCPEAASYPHLCRASCNAVGCPCELHDEIVPQPGPDQLELPEVAS